MTSIPAVPVTECLGWKLADDNIHALVAFRQPDGQEFVLAIPQMALEVLIASLIGATASFPPPRGLGKQEEFAMKVDWFDHGHTPSTGEHFLRFRLASQGHLAFTLNRTLIERLNESFAVALETSPTNLMPDTP